MAGFRTGCHGLGLLKAIRSLYESDFFTGDFSERTVHGRGFSSVLPGMGRIKHDHERIHPQNR